MASTTHVVLVGAEPGTDDYARRRLHELERRWSRFRDDSEVSRLNGSPEALLVVSEDTVRLVATMLEAWRITDGRYDPTLLAAIDAAGYTTSVDGSGRRSAGVPGAPRRRTPADVRVHPEAPLVVVPAGAGIDPGGIGKGLAADVVVTELLDARRRRRPGRHRRRPRRGGHAAYARRLARGRRASARPLARRSRV